MTITGFTIGARVAFLHEKLEQAVSTYGEVSIAEKKVTIAQEALQRSQLCWVAGRAGV